MNTSLSTHAPTTQLYTLSLHDALPICGTTPDALPFAFRDDFILAVHRPLSLARLTLRLVALSASAAANWRGACRSEEHTSELQSHVNLVCRLLLEKKKTNLAKST